MRVFSRRYETINEKETILHANVMLTKAEYSRCSKEIAKSVHPHIDEALSLIDFDVSVYKEIFMKIQPVENASQCIVSAPDYHLEEDGDSYSLVISQSIGLK